MRWWLYQKERFPIAAHGPLILAFSACAVSYSAGLRGGWPSATAYGVAFVTCFLFFLQLRIADEFKDAGEDARWRPYRPVPRGLVKLSELRVVFIAAGVAQAGLAWWFEPRLLWVLLGGWAYLALMSVEFFARDWLKARPVVYLLTHMGIMPLVDLYATACDWLPAQGAPPAGLIPFLTASFFNGIVIEIGRKIRLPADEEEGVETYSKLWSRQAAITAWWSCQLLTAAFAVWAASAVSHEVAWVLTITLVIAGLGSFWLGRRFLKHGMSGKRIEMMAGIWTLVLYVSLGGMALWSVSMES